MYKALQVINRISAGITWIGWEVYWWPVEHQENGWYSSKLVSADQQVLYILHHFLNPQGQPCVKQIIIVISSSSPDPGNFSWFTTVSHSRFFLIYPFYFTIALQYEVGWEKAIDSYQSIWSQIASPSLTLCSIVHC